MYPTAIQAAISTLYINSSENDKNILDSILIICIVQENRGNERWIDSKPCIYKWKR